MVYRNCYTAFKFLAGFIGCFQNFAGHKLFCNCHSGGFIYISPGAYPWFRQQPEYNNCTAEVIGVKGVESENPWGFVDTITCIFNMVHVGRVDAAIATQFLGNTGANSIVAGPGRAMALQEPQYSKP